MESEKSIADILKQERFKIRNIEESLYIDALERCNNQESFAKEIYSKLRKDDLPPNLVLLYKAAVKGKDEKAKLRIMNRMYKIRDRVRENPKVRDIDMIHASDYSDMNLTEMNKTLKASALKDNKIQRNLIKTGESSGDNIKAYAEDMDTSTIDDPKTMERRNQSGSSGRTSDQKHGLKCKGQAENGTNNEEFVASSVENDEFNFDLFSEMEELKLVKKPAMTYSGKGRGKSSSKNKDTAETNRDDDGNMKEIDPPLNLSTFVDSESDNEMDAKLKQTDEIKDIEDAVASFQSDRKRKLSDVVQGETSPECMRAKVLKVANIAEDAIVEQKALVRATAAPQRKDASDSSAKDDNDGKVGKKSTTQPSLNNPWHIDNYYYALRAEPDDHLYENQLACPRIAAVYGNYDLYDGDSSP